MASYIEDETSINVSVSKALESWSEKPAAGPQGTAGKKLHALMFTDIVNSTQKTQELGDHGAQQMVHIHNQIVRTALINNYGKEVKHMGDGIMAVFPSSASSASIVARPLPKRMICLGLSFSLPRAFAPKLAGTKFWCPRTPRTPMPAVALTLPPRAHVR